MKIIATIMALLFAAALRADYSSLTTEERARVLFALEKSKVYIDLAQGAEKVYVDSPVLVETIPIDGARTKRTYRIGLTIKAGGETFVRAFFIQIDSDAVPTASGPPWWTFAATAGLAFMLGLAAGK